MLSAMAGTIVIGFDDSDGAERALDRAIAEATSSGDALVVVAVFEMMFDPEGPQSFGSLGETPEMMPLVEPPELEPIFAKARARRRGGRARGRLRLGRRQPGRQDRRHRPRPRARASSCWPRHHHGFLGRLFGTDVAAEVERELGSGVVVVD